MSSTQRSVMMMVMLMKVLHEVLRGMQRLRRKGAPPDHVREDGRTADILHENGHQLGQLDGAQALSERARPLEVTNEVVRIRGEGNVHLRGGEEGNLTGSLGDALVLHVACHGEELIGVHVTHGAGLLYHLRDSVKGLVVLLAEGEGGEGAVGGVLEGALDGHLARGSGQLLRPKEVIADADVKVGREDGRGDAANGLQGGKVALPELHQVEDGLEADLTGAADQPLNDGLPVAGLT